MGSTTYPLVIDPLSYSEVDITDFAPSAVSGAPGLSELGLYVDTGQQLWGHGFGQWEFSEPQSYAFTGQMVDTRHGFVSLFTEPTDIGEVFGYPGNDFAASLQGTQHKGQLVLIDDNTIHVLGDALGLYTIGEAGTHNSYSPGGDTYREIMDTGEYFILAENGTLMVGTIAAISTINEGLGEVYVLTSGDLACDLDTDIFADNGYVYNLTRGDAIGISSNTSNVITVTTPGTLASWDNNDIIVLVADTGNDINTTSNFINLTKFGGYYWASERNTNIVHFWSEDHAQDAEGRGLDDLGAITVGPTGTPIVNMVAYDNQLWVFREDGAWTIGDDNLAYQTNLMFADQQSSTNFQEVVVWQGFMIFPIRNRLYKYRSGLQDITPPRWNDELPYKEFGNWKGFVVRGRYLYVAGQSNAANSDETSQSTAGFGAVFATDGVGWHKVYDFEENDVVAHYGLILDPTKDRLLVFYNTDGANPLWPAAYDVKYIQFQTLSDLPYAAYPTTGDHNLYTSIYTFGLKRIPKSFASLTLGADYDTGTSVDVEYRIEGGSWTALGTFTSDMQEIAFPDSTTGKDIQFKLNLQTNNSAYTPVVKNVIIKMMLRPDVLYGVTLDVMISDDLSDPKRKQLGLTAKEIRAALKSARSSVSPIEFTDLYGDTADAYLASLRFIIVAYEDMDAVQSIARCTLVYV